MKHALFPIHRPRIGVSVSSTSISLVELRRRWFRKPVIQRLLERTLPAGLLKVSPAEPHVTDMDAFAKELLALTEHLDERAIALTLPNRALHMGVFSFDTFPHVPEEREALLKWRFREELNLALGDARVMIQVFPDEGTTQVLAIAVRQTIVDQYEEVVARAGLIPVSIGVSLFQLVGLYRPLIHGHRRLCVLQWVEDEFVLLMFDQGRPMFLRTRSMAKGTLDLRRELVGTLQYVAEQSSFSITIEAGEAACPLYLITTHSKDAITQLLGGELTVKVPCVGGTWQIEIVLLGWESVPSQLGSHAGSFNGLSAMASVVGR